MASTTCKGISLIGLLKDLGVEGLRPVRLYYDNKVTIHISSN